MELAAVSQRVDRSVEYGERRDALDQRLARWLASSGVLAVPVPNGLVHAGAEDALASWLRAVSPRCIVLSGGNDIGTVPERDATECKLLEWAREHRLPLLGICRGMQMLAIEAGAVLHAVDGHAGTRHALVSTSTEHSIPQSVSSYHRFGLRDCPRGYTVLARASDGCIEAIRHMSLPWEGWMWHPEREGDGTLPERQGIARLLQVAATGRGN